MSTRDKGYGSGQPQLDVKTKGYEFRYKYNIPAEFRSRVCTCEQMVYTTKGPAAYGCICGKPPVHALHKCVDCGEIFIKDFSFEWFCGVCPTCYNCSKDIAAPCLLHDIVPILRERFSVNNGAPLGKPKGLNPKRYTEEEMKDFSFDF